MILPLWHHFTYFPHQKEGIEWMLANEMEGVVVPYNESEISVYGGLQCDEMGLGKTIQMCSVMINHVVPETVLLAPLAMLDTWADVCHRAGMKVMMFVDHEWKEQTTRLPVRPHRAWTLAGHGRPAVFITNYEKLIHCPSAFDRTWGRVVLDEAHRIRNGKGQIAKAAMQIAASFRWAMTGTPLVNTKKDVISLLAFIGVPVLPSWKWAEYYDDILPSVVLHRTLESVRDVVAGAPPVPEEHHLQIEFETKEEEAFYSGVQGACASFAKRHAMDQLDNTKMFKLLLRLRQISVHPQIYINAKRRESKTYRREDWVGPSSKMTAVQQIIESDRSSTKIHKYIVFCQFADEMKMMKSYLIESGSVDADHILMYDGSMTQMERAAVLKRSKETTQHTVLLLQLQAGGVGLNLQEYDRIIFISPWWTASLRNQAIARAVRMGQTKVVKVFHLRLAAENSNIINIDHMVHRKAEEKQEMLDELFELVDGGAAESDQEDELEI